MKAYERQKERREKREIERDTERERERVCVWERESGRAAQRRCAMCVEGHHLVLYLFHTI